MREVSLGELKSEAREISDTENDPFVTDAWLANLANRHIQKVFSRLVDAGPADYYAATAQITTEAGLETYPLEGDFRNLTGVFVRESSDERRQLFPMPVTGRRRFKAPTGIWTLDIEYIPVLPKLEDDGDTFDAVSGFEDLVINLMARDICKKRQVDATEMMQDVVRLEAEIVSRARQRDKLGGKRVTDLDDMTVSPFPWGFSGSSRLACYRLRGDNLEIYESLWGLP